MARIKKVDFIDYGTNRRAQAILEYEPNKEFFFIKCPKITEHMWGFNKNFKTREKAKQTDIAGFKNMWIHGGDLWFIGGDTANECINNFKAFIEISKNKKIKPRKVIVLKLKCVSPDIFLAKDRVFQKENEIEISFSYAICYEVQSPFGSKDYFEQIENGIPKNRIPCYDHYALPYSKETEAFCVWFLDRTQELVKIIHDRLGTEQRLLDTIKSGIKFLPGETQ